MAQVFVGRVVPLARQRVVHASLAPARAERARRHWARRMATTFVQRHVTEIVVQRAAYHIHGIMWRSSGLTSPTPGRRAPRVRHADLHETRLRVLRNLRLRF